jgi:hypothetical protein
MTLHISWWMIPSLITALGFSYALLIHQDSPGYGQGLGNLLLLIPASVISIVSWIIAAVLK